MRAALVALSLMLASSASGGAAEPTVSRAWIATSDRNTQFALDAQAQFDPESASEAGVARFDGLAMDLGPKRDQRWTAAMEQVVAELRRRLVAETNPAVRQDLQILIHSIQQDIDGTRLQRLHFVAWSDAPKMMFDNLRALLDDQVSPARRQKAVELLRRYVGDWPGTTPLTSMVKARFEETDAPGLLGPDRVAVNRSLSNGGIYSKGIRELFAKYKVKGADAALAKFDAQVADYETWQRNSVLPRARSDFRLPADVYAFRLKQVGIDVDPQTLIRMAQVEFAETRAAMNALAPNVAKAKGWSATSYPEVIRLLKKETVPNDKLEASYAAVIKANEAAITRERIVDLPTRPMLMRLASAAESAASPAPHMQPPPMINNKGERGTFVLPIGVAVDDPAAAYDDFNFPAAEWTVAAHEGRPGHELQFSAMIERGVSKARILYAFNSVNVEGWALYAEAEALPYHPLDGQLMALQARLLRAARAMLDPMLNTGMISIEDARRILIEQVCSSPAMARQEIERYTSRSPGQAGSYFYGYSRLLQLRIETELALGKRFDRLKFNNFVINQGLLPPDLLAQAVRDEFIPASLRE